MTLMSFALFLALTSSIIGLLTLAIAKFTSPLRDWPFYWAVGLISGVMAAVLAVGFSEVPISESYSQVMPDSIQGVFYPDILAANEWVVGQRQFQLDWSSIALIGVAIIYFLGVVIGLLRLAFGRYRAWGIVNQSMPVILQDGAEVRLTNQSLPCMTMTPLGQPNQSVIVMSEVFYSDLTQDELLGVIEHEKAHIQRRDDEMAFVLRICLVLSWFNPISHNLWRRWTAASELQCDHIAMADPRDRFGECREFFLHQTMKDPFWGRSAPPSTTMV